MHASRLTALNLGRKGVVLGLAAFGALAVVFATAAPASAATLWNQYDNASTDGVISQNFETANDAKDDQVADDFVVPSNEKWRVKQVNVDGVDSASNTADSVNVAFYKDSAGLPGDQVFSAPNVVPSASSVDFKLPLSPAARLKPGKTYWVSVQANLDSALRWYWTLRTVVTGNEAAIQIPGDGYGFGCTSWTPLSTCDSATPDGLPRDVVFSLRGKAVAIVP